MYTIIVKSISWYHFPVIVNVSVNNKFKTNIWKWDHLYIFYDCTIATYFKKENFLNTTQGDYFDERASDIMV